jgi:polyisoprenoid-binding protein YceI
MGRTQKTVRHLLTRPSWFFLVALLAAVPRVAWAVEYHVDTSQTNDVRFVSEAPIEDFEGVTSRIDGYVLWKGDSLVVGDAFEGSELYFEVPLADLHTGLEMRDQHMRDNYLHTGRFPYVSYKGKIDRVESHGADTLLVVTSGQVELHGKKKDYRIDCQVFRFKQGYHVAAAFVINLKDFDIKVPSLMFMKVSESVLVKVAFHVAKAK